MITTAKRYIVECLNCSIKATMKDYTSATMYANNHITLVADNGDRPNTNHIATITEQTIIGENV